tara:strand:- start:2243 stop:3664 length:1422 start_codon:yes stop_codon:yes gene_type:complete
VTLITDTAVGRFSTSVDEVMSHVRKPVFVDNAIHHARVEVAMDGKNKVTIEKSNTTTFKVTPERRYKIVEGESSLQVTHNLTPGHRYTGNPFYSDDKISSSNQPDLLFNADAISERLAPSSNASSATGRTLFLQNMKNQRIANVGFSGDKVHFANPIDVGLRTTDLAIKMGKSLTGTGVRVNIGLPLSSGNTGNTRNHSTRYLAQNFNEVNLKSALKFISRHDKRMILFDKFGNLLYVPLRFTESERVIDSSLRLGNEKEDPIEDTPNRILIQGGQRALNDHAQVIVDNAEQQSGDEGVIVGEPTVITDMSVRTKQGAKRVARQILQANAAAKGSITSTGHMRNTDLRPGDTVVFNGVQTAVVESRHKLPEGISDLVLMNVDTGLEGVLTGIREGSVIEKQGSNPDTTQQKQTINLGFFGNIKINVALNIKERGVGTTKILLGGTKGTKTRGKIGKNGLQLGAAKRGVNNIRK